MTDVTLEWPAQHVAVIGFRGPRLNALGKTMRQELAAKLKEAEGGGARSVVLHGRGEVFSAGADLTERSTWVPGPDEARSGSFLLEFEDFLQNFERSKAVIVAAVEGYAMGGGLELALASDLRVVAEDAVFAAAGAKVGLMANPLRLVSHLGVGRAKQLLFTAESFDGSQLDEWGVATALPRDGTLERAVETACRIARLAPLSNASMKRLIASHLASPVDYLDQLDDEFRTLVMSRDHAAAMSSGFGNSVTFRGD